MAAINFPNAPADQEEYLAPNGVTYIWIDAKSAWATLAGPPGATELSDLIDAQITVAADGHMLIWDGALTAFVNQPLYSPAGGFIEAPTLKKYVVGFGFVQPHIVENIRIGCRVGSGTVTGIIRDGATEVDTIITSLDTVAYDTTVPANEYASTGANLMAIDDSLVLEVVSEVSVADLWFRFRVRRLFT